MLLLADNVEYAEMCGVLFWGGIEGGIDYYAPDGRSA